MPGEQSKVKRNLQFNSPSRSGWKCSPQVNSENGIGTSGLQKITAKAGAQLNISDEDRTITDPMISQVVKDVVQAVHKLDIDGKGIVEGEPTEKPRRDPQVHITAKKGTWTRQGRPDHAGRQRRGPTRSLSQAARKNPSVGQVAAALSAGLAARAAALQARRQETAKGVKEGAEANALVQYRNGMDASQGQLNLNNLGHACAVSQQASSDPESTKQLYANLPGDNLAVQGRVTGEGVIAPTMPHGQLAGRGKRAGEDLELMQLDDGGNIRFSFESSKRSRGTWSEEPVEKPEVKKVEDEAEATSPGATDQLTGAEDRACQET